MAYFKPLSRNAHAGLALAAAGWMLCAGLAQAAEAGRIVFASGEVRNGARTLAVGDAVQEGEQLLTGADGYVYMKTVDDGLLILRPNSHARIVTYHVDRAQPANTRVKLELVSGVARSVSGSAVKQARQNFRFNTPVAAIGVRGTDFSVSTSQETSNVTVLSGAIVVSGFGGVCTPGGTGPCEHAASRELGAGQPGQMLQVRRGLTTPQLLTANGQAPDNVAPPRSDEPGRNSGSAGQPLSSTEPSLDAQKTAALLQQALVRNNVTPPVTVPPVTLPPTETVVSTDPATPASQLVWGRWAAVLNQPATIDTAKQVGDKATRVAMDSYYALFRTQGADWQVPQAGSAGFSLAQSEAVLSNDGRAYAMGKLENGTLNVDFGKATFRTAFDLLADTERFKLQAEGVVGSDGGLIGNNPLFNPTTTNMTVNGALGPANNAAYIFSSKLDAHRSVNGVTYWQK